MAPPLLTKQRRNREARVSIWKAARIDDAGLERGMGALSSNAIRARLARAMRAIVRWTMKPMLIATLLFALVGCARAGAGGQAAEPSGSPAASAPTAAAGAGQTGTVAGSACGCPMMVPGATASVADIDGGVAITWSAPPSEVANLRERVHGMAQQKGAMMAACPCRAGAGAPAQGMMSMQAMPPADVRADDVEGGARLTFTAKNAADVPALRSHVRMHIEHMKSGCPMM